MHCFRKRFTDSVVLVRTYATVPYDALPARDRFFVQTVAENQKQVSLLNRNTPVLSLLGQRELSKSGVTGTAQNRTWRYPSFQKSLCREFQWSQGLSANWVFRQAALRD
jgi:hypothetical protein